MYHTKAQSGFIILIKKKEKNLEIHRTQKPNYNPKLQWPIVFNFLIFLFLGSKRFRVHTGNYKKSLYIKSQFKKKILFMISFCMNVLHECLDILNSYLNILFCFQRLEGAKRLQLGRLRLAMLKFEVGRLKRGRGSPQSQMLLTSKSNKKVLARPSYAGVSLSDIRIPLMWKRKVNVGSF